MMIDPTVTDLLKIVDDRYKLVILTSKRARQLTNGSKPLTDKKEPSNVTLAAQEIAEGKVVIVDEDEVEDKENTESEANENKEIEE